MSRKKSRKSKRKAKLREKRQVTRKLTRSESLESPSGSEVLESGSLESESSGAEPLSSASSDAESAPQHRVAKIRDRAQRLKAREVTQRVGQVNQSVQGQLKDKRSSLYTWYMSRSNVERALLGLIIIPILAVLVLLQGVILPALVVVGGTLFAASKIIFILFKGGAFVVYISYKVFKTILGIYLCVNRSITGWRAHKLRARQASVDPTPNADYPTLRSVGYESIKLEASPKRLTLTLSERDEATEEIKSHIHPVLFSYLRYFLIGQLRMYLTLWRERGVCIQVWRPEGRARIKEILQATGKTIFKPHLCGPHINHKRILVPGDAQLIEVSAVSGSARDAQREALYVFEIRWRDHHVLKRWPFIKREDQQQIWRLNVPLNLDSLTEDQIGYRPEIACGVTDEVTRDIDKTETPQQS